jgi:hypothetical protein
MVGALSFDRWQFENEFRARPVSRSSQISFDDYSRSMSTRTRKQVYERRLPTPIWSLENSSLRALLVGYLENRVGIRKPQGTLLERRAAAEKRSKDQIPRLNERIDRLQLKYVAVKRKGRLKAKLRKLEQEIENLDTCVRMCRRGGLDIVAAVVVLYYRCGLNSVEVGEEVRLRPPHVRMILFRLHEVWNKKFNLAPHGTTHQSRVTAH